MSCFRESVDKRQSYITQSCINEGGKDLKENCLLTKSGDMFTFIKGTFSQLKIAFKYESKLSWHFRLD